MAETRRAPQQSARLANAGPFMRADALANRERILDAALTLAGELRVSMAAIAAAAGIARSTLCCHFPMREDLNRALAQTETHAERHHKSTPCHSPQSQRCPFQAPGQLGRQ